MNSPRKAPPPARRRALVTPSGRMIRIGHPTHQHLWDTIMRAPDDTCPTPSPRDTDEILS